MGASQSCQNDEPFLIHRCGFLSQSGGGLSRLPFFLADIMKNIKYLLFLLFAVTSIVKPVAAAVVGDVRYQIDYRQTYSASYAMVSVNIGPSSGWTHFPINLVQDNFSPNQTMHWLNTLGVAVCSEHTDGTLEWKQTTFTNQLYTNDFYNQISSGQQYTGLLPTEPCTKQSPCLVKSGQSNYNLDMHVEGSVPNTPSSCYENCKTTANVLWTDCINGQCVTSVKHTFTGDECSGEPAVNDLEPTPPDRCNEELDAKIAACGGSLNVQSFDFESCSGVCAPDDCHSAWLAKVNECGGIMAVSSWNAETCTGVCASDPIPNLNEPPDGVSPKQVETNVTQNPDGTSTTTSTATFDYQGTTYTETRTTTYDAQGNSTGTTVVTAQGASREPSNPGVPDNLELDTSVGDAKNWTQYDDPSQVAQNRANQDFQNIPSAGPLPLQMDINVSGSPALSGVMFGRTIEIRFDRPWMQTGYSIMATMLVGIGYLQVFLMINRTIIER